MAPHCLFISVVPEVVEGVKGEIRDQSDAGGVVRRAEDKLNFNSDPVRKDVNFAGIARDAFFDSPVGCIGAAVQAKWLF